MIFGPIIFAVMSTLGIVAVASAADTTREKRTRAVDDTARAKRRARRKRHARTPKKPPKPDTAPVSKGLREPHTVDLADDGKKAPAKKRTRRERMRARMAKRRAGKKLTPKRAATLLYTYVSVTISEGKARTLGSKGAPNAKVKRAQRAMGGLTADGIYGPKTRARGKALTGRTFPRRKKRGSSRRTTTPGASSTQTPAPSSTTKRAPAPPPPEADDEPIETEEEEEVILASTTPAALPADTGRTKKRAALDLQLHARAAPSGDGRGAWFGYRDHPNSIVQEAQQDMGGLTADGIYGPNTRARGKELTGQDFPRR